MLLTDGGVMCQSASNVSAWYKLTPDPYGNYANGTWSSLASIPSPYAPYAFASAVLADGRVVVVGGEYTEVICPSGASPPCFAFDLTNLGAIYDPQSNTWTMLPPPQSPHFQCIGDAPSTVLADGRLIIGSKLYQDLAALDPRTLTWSLISATGKTDTMNSEEGWTLLPDGSFFTLDVAKAPSSERFLLSAPGSTTGVWVNSGNTPQDLHTPPTLPPTTAPGCPTYDPPGEIGPTPLLPDGTVFAIGADGLITNYVPPTTGSTPCFLVCPLPPVEGPTGAGTWTWIVWRLPSGLTVQDGPAAVLPSGHVLFGANQGSHLQYFEGAILPELATYFVPYYSPAIDVQSVPAPTPSDATAGTSLLVLPSGQVMFTDGTLYVQLYTPASWPQYDIAWAPTISRVPSNLNSGVTYQITGTQFNGLDQGSYYGDEFQNATNYPLVRITDLSTGHVFYAKTHNHSTMGVATGNATVSTNFDVPCNIEGGTSTVQVVANGIPSTGVNVGVSSDYVTTTTVTSSANPSVFSQSVTFTSRTTPSGLSGSSGTITFKDGNTTLGTFMANHGIASFATSTLAVGTHSISAVYGGNGCSNASTSPALNQVVNQD